MTHHQTVKQKLEEVPAFRERRWRHEGLVRLALRECGIERKYKEGLQLTINELSEFAIAYDSFRHAWTDCTRDYENLRGTDWCDKKTLEAEKKLSLGYQPNHYQVKETVCQK